MLDIGESFKLNQAFLNLEEIDLNSVFSEILYSLDRNLSAESLNINFECIMPKIIGDRMVILSMFSSVLKSLIYKVYLNDQSRIRVFHKEYIHKSVIGFEVLGNQYVELDCTHLNIMRIHEGNVVHNVGENFTEYLFEFPKIYRGDCYE